jgi:hypothetical protein
MRINDLSLDGFSKPLIPFQPGNLIQHLAVRLAGPGVPPLPIACCPLQIGISGSKNQIANGFFG